MVAGGVCHREADVGGCHRVKPGNRIACLTLAHRYLARPPQRVEGPHGGTLAERARFVAQPLLRAYVDIVNMEMLTASASGPQQTGREVPNPCRRLSRSFCGGWRSRGHISSSRACPCAADWSR